ncbi:succinyl-diaminopimelate desuccinylase [Nitratiruptor tergarcus]|uniref:Succinyl-diaminopimelate desuccinylase n=1 Tax=Nitratiruptor tergarcus DSM 16512 TaxID=1069081 RepID=A0A1W1WUR7_9BACT|nr:succinyl-diaminopimelate desuccinylase [Nitratiruptor tergarcus]SMC09955.1 succinyldiaminopimelate desuccinylase [Nitratiruptor tergarcus DSM 16512]
MEIIDLFKQLLSFPSITPDDAGSLEFIKEYLEDYEALWFNKEGVKNLILYKKFGEGEHLCFAGHVDVVPPGEGWNSDPFEPIEKDGYIYARGAQDMKSGVAAFVQAAKETKEFNGTLSLLLTSDEEGDAKWGTRYALQELKRMGMIPDYAIVAEPTCEKEFGDAIKIGRRGSVNGVIEKIGKQGHAAYPEKAINPIHKVAQVLPHMAGVDLDEGDEFFAPSKFVITDIRAGMEVTNVTPGKLKMMFNVRNNTKTTMQDIERFVHKYFDGMNYSLQLSQSAKPFITDPDSKIVKLIDKAIQKVTGITPKHSTAGGTSDARFLAEYGVKTIEFGVKNDTIHAPNERVHKDEVVNLYRVFLEVIESF